MARLSGLAVVDRRPGLALAGLVVASSALRLAAALALHTPLYFPDEYLYSTLARGFAHGTVAEVRGSRLPLTATISYAVPLVLAPIWRLHSVAASYRLSQAVGSVAFSLAAVPAYRLARRAGSGIRPALLVAGLTLAVPAGVLTGMVMTEPYAYTAFLVAVLIAVEGLRRPTLGRLVLTAAAGVALLPIGGLQFGIFLPAVLVAHIAAAASSRRRTILLMSTVALLLGAILGLVVLGGRSPFSEFLTVLHQFDQPPGQVVSWLWINVFLLAVSAGWVVVPGVVLGLSSLTRSARLHERGIAVLLLALLVGLLYEAATWSAKYDRTYQRFAFYGVPLLLVGFVRWLEHERRERIVFAAVAYAAAAAALFTPLAGGMHVGGQYAPPLTGLAYADPASTAVAWAPILAVLATATGLVGQRFRRGLVVAATAVCVTACVVTSAAFVWFAHDLPALRLPLRGSTVYVTSPVEDGFAQMRNLFWNPAADRVVVAGGTVSPDGFAADPAELSAAGELVVPGTDVAVGGPFVSGDGLLAARRGRPLTRDAAASQFGPPIDLLAIGWYSDGYVAPYVLFYAAGGRSGTSRMVRVWSTTGPKRVEFSCPGGERRAAVGRKPVPFVIAVAPNATKLCSLRLIGGMIEVVDGHDVALNAAIR